MGVSLVLKVYKEESCPAAICPGDWSRLSQLASPRLLPYGAGLPTLGVACYLTRTVRSPRQIVSLHPSNVDASTRPPKTLPRTGFGGEQTLAKGVSRGTSMPSLPFARGSYTGQEAPPGPTRPPCPGQAFRRERKRARSLLSWKQGFEGGTAETPTAARPHPGYYPFHLVITWHP